MGVAHYKFKILDLYTSQKNILYKKVEQVCRRKIVNKKS
jgi:hypothetical protein